MIQNTRLTKVASCEFRGQFDSTALILVFRKEIYRQKMNKKIDALSKSNVKSLILYSYDMKTGKYKEIVNNFLGIKEVKQCQSA